MSDEVNFAFMDYQKSEMTWETYADVGEYGQMAPYVLVFHNGKAYHMNQSTAQTLSLLKFVQNFTEEALYSEKMGYARDELTIYWEYAKNDIGGDRRIEKFTRQMYKEYNETWWFQNVFKPYFGLEVTRK